MASLNCFSIAALVNPPSSFLTYSSFSQLAGAVLSLSPVFGPSLTVDYLVNIFLHLIKDEVADVRLKLIGTLGELSSVMGIDVLSQSLLPREAAR